ncbi:MAG: carbonic anhydrase [Saprospiraceae bacterium]
MELQTIFDRNKTWIKSKLNEDEKYFDKLAAGQSPQILYIGCSDSRVTAEEVMGMGPGDVFVHRNIANLVPNADLNVMSVIEYAVEHLKVDHVVICGHYGCGGVKAAMQSADLGILNPWLRNIRDVYRTHKDELEAITDETAKYRRLVELNVQEQAINAIQTPVVQKAAKERGITVHGWVFDLASGEIIDLKQDFTSILSGIKPLYEVG